MTSTMQVNLRKIAVTVAVAGFWIGVWCLGVFIANQNLLMPLPYPWDVAVTLWDKMGDGAFWLDVLNSFTHVVVGFLLAMAVGCGLAVLTTRFALLHALFSPILSMVRAVPVVTFIFLVFLWISPDQIPTFIAFLMVIPLVWENVRQGILHTDRQLLEMAQVFRLPLSSRLRRVWIPSVRPYLQAAISTGFGFAWKSGIAAEAIASTGNSIGYQIAAAKRSIEYTEVFASTVMVVLLSVALEWLLRRLLRKEVAQ